MAGIPGKRSLRLTAEATSHQHISWIPIPFHTNSVTYDGAEAITAAVTNALLGNDPDVEHLRLRIGIEIRDRLVEALGEDADPDVLETLELLYAGALLRAGIGYGSYADLADRLERSATIILE